MPKEYLDLVSEFISKVGFPIFVAVVLLWRDEHRHADNIRAMNDLTHAVKDQHLAGHCKKAAERRRQNGRRRRPRDKHR